MRGLALATLFLGMALIDPGSDMGARMAMALARLIVFIVALVIIFWGI